jgi:hypothetical protein
LFQKTEGISMLYLRNKTSSEAVRLPFPIDGNTHSTPGSVIPLSSDKEIRLGRELAKSYPRRFETSEGPSPVSASPEPEAPVTEAPVTEALETETAVTTEVLDVTPAETAVTTEVPDVTPAETAVTTESSTETVVTVGSEETPVDAEEGEEGDGEGEPQASPKRRGRPPRNN